MSTNIFKTLLCDISLIETSGKKLLIVTEQIKMERNNGALQKANQILPFLQNPTASFGTYYLIIMNIITARCL